MGTVYSICYILHVVKIITFPILFFAKPIPFLLQVPLPRKKASTLFEKCKCKDILNVAVIHENVALR